MDVQYDLQWAEYPNITQKLQRIEGAMDMNPTVGGEGPTRSIINQVNKNVKQATIFFFILCIYAFIHMCIHCMGHFSHLSPGPTLSPNTTLPSRQNLFCSYL
jgi:hypothetical protein